ncbi:MAG: hypothetical protein LBU37_15085 [Tannerellaceae bacterium]|nr:hypothetical protein [Tannerellaceae bacterium]
MKINHYVKEGSKLYLIMYWGNDRLKFGEKDSSVNDDGEYSMKDINKFNWGNLLAVTGYSHALNDRLQMDISASYTRYASALRRNYLEKQDGAFDEKLDKSTENSRQDILLQSNFGYFYKDMIKLKWGLSYSFHHFRPEQMELASMNVSSKTRSNYSAQSGNIYIENEWNPFRALSIYTGLRFVLYHAERENHYFLVLMILGEAVL